MPEFHPITAFTNIADHARTTLPHVDPAEPRCALYLRISLDTTGQGLAVDRQREDCTAIAHARGWTIVGEYVDNSISASDARKNRPGYAALSAAYAAGGFDALVCYDLDRLTRQPRQLEDWIDAAEHRGLLLVTANGEADLTTDGGRLFARIKLAVARAEVERKSARQTRAARQRAEMGRPPLGVRLTGYTPRGDTIPAEAAIVREVFERFAAGDTLRGIRSWLDSEHPPRRGASHWHPSTVRGILTNPRYAGRAVYQGKVTGQAGGWEPLVDADVFDYVQGVLEDPSRRKQRSTERRYLGSGLYRCGVCGDVCSSWSGVRYRCRRGCVTRSIPPVDRWVEFNLEELLARPDYRRLLEGPGTDTSGDRELIASLQARRARFDDDYAAGRIGWDLHAKAVGRVEAEMAVVEERVARAVAQSGGIDLGPDPVVGFRQAPLYVRRAVVERLVVVRLCSIGEAPAVVAEVV